MLRAMSRGRYMVRFDGGEDRPPQEANIAWIRERTVEAE